jgi:hypothetical protein
MGDRLSRAFILSKVESKRKNNSILYEFSKYTTALVSK